MKAMKSPEPWEASAAAWALGRLLDVNPAAMPDEAQVWLGWVAWDGWDGWDVLLSLLITSITLWIQRMQTKQTKGIRHMFL